MKMILRTLPLVLAGGVTLSGCCTSRHAQRRWQYKTEAFTQKVIRGVGPAESYSRQLDAFLNEYGERGWSLVSARDGFYTFERPLH